jgi:hypothetical protein
MASYVIVWEQNMYGQKKTAGHTWPGHSSINIGDDFDPPFSAPATGDVGAAHAAYVGTLHNNYVSYWPFVAGATFGVADVFGKRPAGDVKRSIADDIKAEGFLPDWVIKLASSNAKEQDMLAEWNAVRTKVGKSYGAFKKNCSTIVSRVLHAGGFYAKKWAIDCNWVWAPGDIRRLALEVGGTRMKWSEVTPLLTASGITPAAYWSRDYTRDAAYSNIGTPSKYYFGARVSGIGGNP